MFGIGGGEMLVIVVVTLIVFGPKELPKAMRSAGSMMRTFSRISGDFRKQFDQALREAEKELDLEEARKAVEANVGRPVGAPSPASHAPWKPAVRTDVGGTAGRPQAK